MKSELEKQYEKEHSKE